MKEYNEFQHEQKAIEEIAKVLNDCCNFYDKNGNHLGNKCNSHDCEYWCDTNYLCCSYNKKEATAIYNAGYEKIPKGAYIRYRWQDKRIYKRIKRLLKSRKQTQRDIFEKLFSYIGSQQQFCIVNDDYKTLIDCDKLFEFVGNLAKQYGVEVE